MSRHILTPCVLLLLLLSACDFSLGLDIMNAANKDITVSIGSESLRIAPGLGFHGTFPAPEGRFTLIGSCIGSPWSDTIGDIAEQEVDLSHSVQEICR